MDNYEQYEKDCADVRKANKNLLERFGAWLKVAGLADKTVGNHISNVDFYINEYLLNYEVIPAKEGAGDASMFLGDWFIRKATWSSAASIKANAASLKKFYTFMQEQGLVEKEALDELKQTIKAEMPEWLATLKRYEDMDEDDMW